MNLALGCALNSNDLFAGFNENKNKEKLSKRQAASIFRACFKLVMDDAINNKIVFKLPNIGAVHGQLYCRMIQGEEFKDQYIHLHWKGLDYLKSNYKGALPTLKLFNKLGQPRYKQLFIDKTRKDILIKKLNEGFQYYY